MIRTIFLGILLLPLYGLADSVVPIDEVKNNVNIRMSPDSDSEVVGQLDQGSSVVLVESIDGWHVVELEGGSTGFISADWTRVLNDAEALAEPAPTVVESVVAVDEVVPEPLAPVAAEPAPEPVAAEAVESNVVADEEPALAAEVAEELEAVIEPVDELLEVVPEAVLDAEEELVPEPAAVASTPEPAPPVAEPVAVESGHSDSEIKLKGVPIIY